MISKVIRRTHMYLALFLTPWMLMYALSTMAMNHRTFFQEIHGDGPPAYQLEQETIYPGTFPENARPRMVADQILASLDLEGSFTVRGRMDGDHLTILRQNPIDLRRITYYPADGKLRVERQAFRTSTFLERMHRRRGYQHNFFLDDTWAVSVDLVIVAMIFWVASGIWMWWELQATRRWGALSALSGVALFGFFLITI